MLIKQELIRHCAAEILRNLQTKFDLMHPDYDPRYPIFNEEIRGLFNDELSRGEELLNQITIFRAFVYNQNQEATPSIQLLNISSNYKQLNDIELCYSIPRKMLYGVALMLIFPIANVVVQTDINAKVFLALGIAGILFFLRLHSAHSNIWLANKKIITYSSHLLHINDLNEDSCELPYWRYQLITNDVHPEQPNNVMHI